MIDVRRIGPDALAIAVTGRVGRAEVDAAFDSIAALAPGQRVDLLVDVGTPLDVAWFESIAAEAARRDDVVALVRAARRVAIVAKAAWVRVVARVEGALLPGVTYRSFTPDQAAAARAWVLDG